MNSYVKQFKEEGFLDVPSSWTLTKIGSVLAAIRKVCPKAVVCQRQTDGTDFPPFMAIESPEYHKICNREEEFTLLEVCNL